MVTLGFTSCLTKPEVLFEFVCCYDIEFESDFIVILHCFVYSTVQHINMCFINKVNISLGCFILAVGSAAETFPSYH